MTYASNQNVEEVIKVYYLGYQSFQTDSNQTRFLECDQGTRHELYGEALDTNRLKTFVETVRETSASSKHQGTSNRQLRERWRNRSSLTFV